MGRGGRGFGGSEGAGSRKRPQRQGRVGGRTVTLSRQTSELNAFYFHFAAALWIAPFCWPVIRPEATH